MEQGEGREQVQQDRRSMEQGADQDGAGMTAEAIAASYTPLPSHSAHTGFLSSAPAK